MSDVTRQLCRHAANLDYAALPAEVRGRARVLLLDLLGNIVCAAHEAESSPSLFAAVESLGLGRGSATVAGVGGGYAPPAAALLNGALGHSLDFDDTHAAASLHPGATVIPAALAACEMVGGDGGRLLGAIVAGYEIACRIGLAVGAKTHYQRGFHPSATVGVFAAATAAGQLFGLDAEGLENALGIAGSQAAGSMQFMANGAWNKRFHVGAAAMNGLLAASLAREGFKGASAAIEGPAGFLAAYAPAPEPAAALTGLGQGFEILNVALKPYPACRLAHAAIDAVVELKREQGFAAAEVTALEIGMSRLGIDICGAPEAAKRHPASFVEGQFSMHFLAAVALRQGSLSWRDYCRHYGDGETMALCQRITVVPDTEVEADYPERLSGRVRLTLGDRRLERKVDLPRGEPENFLDAVEVRRKFEGLVSQHLGPAAGALYHAVMKLDADDDVADLLALLAV
ncbi:MAG TPA: MmgE/PrpD family protein [Alphaproteobacteria bacterium]|nr:MmgE/PrpD family protein [Alphaproteobacteria bacterium]